MSSMRFVTSVPRARTRLILLAAAACWLAGAAPAAPPAPPSVPPHLNLEAMERTAPGWTAVETTGDARNGYLMTERIVWPLFYLHWRPLKGEGGVGASLSVSEAEKVVTTLWDGLTFDAPPAGKRVTMAGHEAVEIEATTSHGEWRSRYLLWACPESDRLFIADASVSLLASAPPQLLDLMSLMSRTVRCHKDVKVEEPELLRKRREIEGTDISFQIPPTWSPVEGYRVQNHFNEGRFSALDHAAPNDKEGQDLILELDSVRRLQLTWQPAPDSAMTFDTLIQEVHEFWKPRSRNILPSGTRVANDVWIMEGLVMTGQTGRTPPSRTHKFRAWVWRRNGMSYLAVGELGGIQFGQRVMNQIQEIADPMLEEMYQGIDY